MNMKHNIVQKNGCIKNYFKQNMWCLYLEPVNSVIPKLTTGDKSRTIDGRFNESITLLCPVQSSPLPNFK